MPIDILFVAYNRLPMTRESFTALMENTNWDEFCREEDGAALYVFDDASTDGTAEWLGEQIERWRGSRIVNPTIHYFDRGHGGPVAAMNRYLDLRTPTDRFAKIDNDFVVCPGWLDEMLKLMTGNPSLDILGTEPWHPGPGAVAPVPDHARRITEARHIGGKGIIRKRAFERCRPSPSGHNGYGGFSEWQMEHEGVRKAWICPDLPCFGLDQLPFEPWLSLTEEYVNTRVARSWGPYASDGTMDAYWDWWTPRWL